MSPDLYERFAEFLDQLPVPYPRTESGVEIRILKRLFTPEQAELAMHLTLLAEESRVVARRVRRPVSEVAKLLDEMARKGLIYARYEPGKAPRYMVAPYVVGFYEGQVDHLTPELISDAEEYGAVLGKSGFWRKAPQMRTIPVQASIEAPVEVLAYERAGEMVRGQTSFGVSNCICRQVNDARGYHCSRPREVCMSFGWVADAFVKQGRARRISLDESLALLAQADEAGLVLQPGNTKELSFICACCSCCCGVLQMLKLEPEPAKVAISSFRAAVDTEKCDGCATCEGRCQMEAISVNGGGIASVDKSRCIGCGLCVSTCPSGAVRLERKPASEQPTVRTNVTQEYLGFARAAGKFSVPALVSMGAKSAIDRLLARERSPLVE
ncbi:MAG: ATP-binding protein [Nitrososphaerales archaeon]